MPLTLVLLPRWDTKVALEAILKFVHLFFLRKCFLSAFTLFSFVTDGSFYRHRYKISSLSLVPSDRTSID